MTDHTGWKNVLEMEKLSLFKRLRNKDRWLRDWKARDAATSHIGLLHNAAFGFIPTWGFDWWAPEEMNDWDWEDVDCVAIKERHGDCHVQITVVNNGMAEITAYGMGMHQYESVQMSAEDSLEVYKKALGMLASTCVERVDHMYGRVE